MKTVSNSSEASQNVLEKHTKDRNVQQEEFRTTAGSRTKKKRKARLLKGNEIGWMRAGVKAIEILGLTEIEC